MSSHLPHHIDPIRYADAGQVLAGEVAFREMPRLSAVITNRDAAAHIDLRFGIDDQGIRGVHGSIGCEVELVCQRCLQPLKLRVNVDVLLGIVASEHAAERLPPEYDPLLVGADPLPVGELVEDEILLALPGFPRHESDACRIDLAAAGPEQPASSESSAKANPFAVLARLKSN